jgi:hypothetical protein
MRRVVPVLLAFVSLAAPLAAQARPDFSGKWTLDTTTVQGPMAPQSMTLVVTQDDKTVKVESAASTQMGEQKGTTIINLDGTASKNTLTTPTGPLDLTSTGGWDGNTFVVTNSAQVQGQPLQMTERWSMDNNGKTLHLDRAVAVAGQNFNVKLTFIKQ